MSEHTLTPWHCVPTISPDDDHRIVYYPIHDENGVSICHVRAVRPAHWDSHNPDASILKAKADDDLIASGRIPSLSRAEGYARFIVRACNSHEELLWACKNALEVVEEEIQSDQVFIDASELADLLRDAIAKATKE